mmetsp:Transcript_44032/g.51579  ORF Transcript_44032/g.51579 Transcript_44032/m.51579 type:complete len:104 (-) Transcript_44032:240-551(-)
MVVLDECDRLLDASDGVKGGDSSSSGGSQSATFVMQMDAILNALPSTAIRCLFSATVTPRVRTLAESALRSPVDITITSGGATDITQELVFVGREDGKLLALK